MARGGSGGRTRVRTARGRSAQSTRWLERQLNDPYVRKAKAEGYRSRAAYKLLELDERFGFLRGQKRILDLGIAPGGWSQVVKRRTPGATVVGIDLLLVDPIEGVTILQMDFMDDAAPERLTTELGGAADLVLSDMAANTVGHQQTDHLRTIAKASPASTSAIVRKWSVCWCPTVFAAMSDRTRSGAPPSASLSFAGAASSMKSISRIVTPSSGSTGSRSMPTTCAPGERRRTT